MKRRWAANASLALAVGAVLLGSVACGAEAEALPRIAAIVTSYYHNSHADVLASRLLEGYNLNGQGEFPKLKLVSLYVDQFPKNDISRRMSRKYGVPIYPTVAEALTVGSDKLAVDGVLLIAEHGEYPLSARGQIEYPKRRLFEQIVKVFEQSRRVVPVFNDKHLADTWQDAKWFYDTSRELKIPLMAGSTLPTTWRFPTVDVERGAPLKELLVTTFGPLEGYTFHALEAAQALAERRAGGETGVASVEVLKDAAVWKAGAEGVYDRELLAAGIARLKEHPLRPDVKLEEAVKHPLLITIRYRDGLKLNVLLLEYAVNEWTAAWRKPDGSIDSTVFWTKEERPLMHFSYLVKGIEQMVHSGKPTWPVERTLLTTGMLAALYESHHTGRRIETPELEFKYTSDWNFQQPPPPGPGRPLDDQ